MTEVKVKLNRFESIRISVGIKFGQRMPTWEFVYKVFVKKKPILPYHDLDMEVYKIFYFSIF